MPVPNDENDGPRGLHHMDADYVGHLGRRGNVALTFAVAACSSCPVLWYVTILPGLVAMVIGWSVWCDARRLERGDGADVDPQFNNLNRIAVKGRQAVILGLLPSLSWGGLLLTAVLGLVS